MTEKNIEIPKEKMKNKYDLTLKKFFYTTSVAMNFFSYGMGNIMVGTSLVDLKYVFGVTDEQISYAPLLLAVGYVFGALCTGQVTRWYNNRQIIMASFLLPMALVNFIILFSSYTFLLVLLFFYGAGFGSCDGSLSVWIVELWPKHNSVILPLTVVLFGLGQVVAPVLMAPFVYGELTNSTMNITVEDRVSSLIVPFTICGVFQIIIPILYIIFNFTNFRYVTPDKTMTEEEKLQAKLDPRIANNPFRMYHLMIAGVAVAAYGGCEQGWNAFGSTMFQHFRKDFIVASEASLLFAYFSIAFTVGLIITTFIAMKLTPDTIIFYQLSLIFVSLFMLFFGYNNRPVIYVATILLGYGMAPLWAMKFAFIENHLKLTDQVASLYTVLFGCFAILVPIILKETAKSNPRMLLIVMISFMVISSSAFVIVKTWLFILARQRKQLSPLR